MFTFSDHLREKRFPFRTPNVGFHCCASDEGLTTQRTIETPPRKITRSMTKGEDPSSMSLSLFFILMPLLALPNFSKTFEIECDALWVLGLCSCKKGTP